MMQVNRLNNWTVRTTPEIFGEVKIFIRESGYFGGGRQAGNLISYTLKFPYDYESRLRKSKLICYQINLNLITNMYDHAVEDIEINWKEKFRRIFMNNTNKEARNQILFQEAVQHIVEDLKVQYDGKSVRVTYNGRKLSFPYEAVTTVEAARNFEEELKGALIWFWRHAPRPMPLVSPTQLLNEGRN